MSMAVAKTKPFSIVQNTRAVQLAIECRSLILQL